MTNLQEVVLFWKELQGVPIEDKLWDKIHFPRCSKAGKMLLDIFEQDKEKTKNCISQVSEKLAHQNIEFTLETIVNKAHQWKYKNQPKPQESNEDKLMRRVCIICKGGRIEPADDNRMMCNQCNADYTDQMAKIELKVA